MYPEKLKVIAQQVQLQQQQEQVRLLHQEKLEREQQHLRTQVSGRGLQGPPEAGLGLPDPASVSSRADPGPRSQSEDVPGSQVSLHNYIESLEQPFEA